MKKLLRRKRLWALLAVSALAGLAWAVIALGDVIDADVIDAQSGNQTTRDLGNVNPGATVTPDVSFQLRCNGARHADQGQTVTMSYSAANSSAPAGGSLSASAATIGQVPVSWPDDTTGGANCPSPAPTLPDNGNSQATIVAPKPAGSYTYTARYTPVLSPAGNNDSSSITGSTAVTFTLTVPNLAPAISSFAGDTSATEGQTKSYSISASDANQDSLTYSLTALAGSASTTITGGNTSSPQVTFNAPGTVTLRTSVSDGTNTTTQDKTVTVASANTAPSKPGKPAASSSLNNDGVFGLNWAASTDAEGNPISYRLEHKDANSSYSLVSGADSLSASSFSFTASASEAEGTWTYQVRASDGSLSSPFSDPSDPVKVDKGAPNPPSISPSKTPEYDPSGTDNDWFKDSVTLAFSANGDPNLQDGSAGSGVDPGSIPGDVTKNTSGSHSVSGTIKDNAGNQASVSRTVNVDASDPTVDIAGCPSGVVGRNSSHAIDVTASDAQSGLATDPTDHALALDTSTAGQHTKSVTAVDNVGHEKSASCTYTVNSPPGTAGKPAASSSLNRGVFSLNWAAASDPDNNVDHYALQHKDANDAGYSPVSGAGSVSGSSFAFTASASEDEGTWTYQAKAVDAFGEDGPYSDPSDPVKVDKSGPSTPSASFDRSPEDATGNWFKDSVKVSYGGSTDPKLADGSDGSGVAGYTAAQTFSTSGSNAYSGKATDNAGNDSSAATGTVKVDATDPVVTPTCPSEVKLGSTATASWTAADAHSGIAGAASGSVSLDTSSVGQKTASVPAGTAHDKVGHGSASASCQYQVVYDFQGFFQPIDNGVMNVAKSGSTIPVKFSLKGDQGLSIFFSSAYPNSGSIACTADPSQDAIEEYSTGTVSGLKYDATADQYIYNWKTTSSWAGSCRQLIVRLADGTYHRADFKFTK
jgi:hypothetical protein